MKLKRPHKRTLQMRTLRADGWTLQRIGDQFGISRERVRQILGSDPNATPMGERRAHIISTTNRPVKGSRVKEPGYLEAQYEAMLAYRKAMKEGLLVPGPCEVCNATKNIDGHHEDYSKPLEVTWLCRRHHQLRHSELRRENLARAA